MCVCIQEPPPSRKRGLKNVVVEWSQVSKTTIFLQKNSNREKLSKFCSKRSFVYTQSETYTRLFSDRHTLYYAGSSFQKSQFNRLSPFSFLCFFLFNFYAHKWILFPFQQTIPNTLKYSKRTTFLCHWNSKKKKRIVTWISYQSSFCCFFFFFFFFVDRKNRESMRCFAAPPWNGGASRTKKRLSLKTFGSLFCFAIYIIISI